MNITDEYSKTVTPGKSYIKDLEYEIRTES